MTPAPGTRFGRAGGRLGPVLIRLGRSGARLGVVGRPSPLAAALLCPVLWSCASSGGAPDLAGGPEAASSPADADYERRVSGLTVLDADGAPYAHPFLGGLNVPRPQFIDIDADGDLDLFVQERTDELMFFENVGTASAPTFEWRTDRYQDLEIGEWNRFADLDADGDMDLLAEEPFSYIRYYRNEGSPSEARFTLLPDSVRDVNGEAVFSDRQNIPSVTDVDCDQIPDLFLGRVEGVVVRYEMVEGSGAEPRFRWLTDRFEDISIVSQFGSLHGANSMMFIDDDEDGDPDLYWGDFFEPGLLRIENRGTCAEPNLRTPPAPAPARDAISTSGYNAPMLTDVDADGDLDLFIGVLGGAFNPNRSATDNLFFYERAADGLLDLRTTRYLNNLDFGSESLTVLEDLDADGDMDLLVSNKIDAHDLQRASLYRLENVGSPTDPRFEHRGLLDVGREYHMAPAFGDLDGDGDRDLLRGTWNKGIAYFRNDGTPEMPRYELVDSQYVTLTRGSNSTPALGDLDGDGDLDLMVGEASGTLNYYRNEGTAAAPDFQLVSDEYGDMDAGRRSAPTLVDVDMDGDLDLVVGRDAGGVAFYRNVGTATEPSFTEDPAFALSLYSYSTPTFGDVDGDGDLDVMSGGASGGVVYLEARGR